MAINLKPVEAHVKLAAPELPADVRTGGENLPLPYPHLYQIQAGDWRISYAVENNRLAILVLEVLNALGESSKDVRRDKMTQKMKIKLLDWPEGAGKPEVPPEVVTNKMKIKWLDLADEGDDGEVEAVHDKGRVRFLNTTATSNELKPTAGKSRITLLDSGQIVDGDAPDGEPNGVAVDEQDRKVTPLDEPSM